MESPAPAAEEQLDHGKCGENGQNSSLGSKAQADKTVGSRDWQQSQVGRYRLGHHAVDSLHYHRLHRYPGGIKLLYLDGKRRAGSMYSQANVNCPEGS